VRLPRKYYLVLILNLCLTKYRQSFEQIRSFNPKTPKDETPSIYAKNETNRYENFIKLLGTENSA